MFLNKFLLIKIQSLFKKKYINRKKKFELVIVKRIASYNTT